MAIAASTQGISLVRAGPIHGTGDACHTDRGDGTMNDETTSPQGDQDNDPASGYKSPWKLALGFCGMFVLSLVYGFCA
ncbi:MAG: hypothetical protein ACOC1F_08870 [Myxococcota bacterium]